VWPDVNLGKDVTLDFKGLGEVALYSTFMQVPKALASGTGREIPVIYAREFLSHVYLRCRSGICEKLRHMRFEPSGWSGNPKIGYAKSLMDYVVFAFMLGLRLS
jgi:hypothetical protein